MAAVGCPCNTLQIDLELQLTFSKMANVCLTSRTSNYNIIPLNLELALNNCWRAKTIILQSEGSKLGPNIMNIVKARSVTDLNMK